MIVIEYELMDVPEADGEREIRIKETNKQTIYKKYS
jgi:hypothetical protein